eukprot:1806864-Pleurochrysis_carterae.AAC.1
MLTLRGSHACRRARCPTPSAYLRARPNYDELRLAHLLRLYVLHDSFGVGELRKARRPEAMCGSTIPRIVREQIQTARDSRCLATNVSEHSRVCRHM